MNSTLPLLDHTIQGGSLTVGEFWDFCNQEHNRNRSFDLISGRVIEIPRRYLLHGYVCARLCCALGTWEQSIGFGHTVSNNCGVILNREPATVLGPDLAFYDYTDSNKVIPDGWSGVAPRLAVEVTCPSDIAGHLDIRIPIYISSGTKLVWVVDPDDQTVTVHRPKRKPETIPADGELDGGTILPGFRSPVSAFFPKPKS